MDILRNAVAISAAIIDELRVDTAHRPHDSVGRPRYTPLGVVFSTFRSFIVGPLRNFTHKFQPFPKSGSVLVSVNRGSALTDLLRAGAHGVDGVIDSRVDVSRRRTAPPTYSIDIGRDVGAASWSRAPGLHL